MFLPEVTKRKFEYDTRWGTSGTWKSNLCAFDSTHESLGYWCLLAVDRGRGNLVFEGLREIKLDDIQSQSFIGQWAEPRQQQNFERSESALTQQVYNRSICSQPCKDVSYQGQGLATSYSLYWILSSTQLWNLVAHLSLQSYHVRSTIYA